MNDLLGLRSSAFASSLLSPPSVRLSPVSSLLILVFLVSGLLHPLSHVCCLRRLSPVPCCESKAGSRCRSDLHAAPSQHTRRAKPRGMHNLRTCRNSRHAESLGVQNLDACRTSGHAEHRSTRTSGHAEHPGHQNLGATRTWRRPEPRGVQTLCACSQR